MNRTLRQLTIAVLVLFGLLFVNLNYVQVVSAERLRDDPRNARVLLETYSRQRGPIVAAGQALARSVETDSRLKYLRRYPGGALYAPITGYYSLVYGSTGIERTYDDVLSGTDEKFFVRRLSDLVTGREPKGGTVELTISPAVQAAAAAALGSRRGAVVALDPRTGAVLAMVTSPSYDPNQLSSHDTGRIRSTWERLNGDALKPLLNRATQETYPPGSVFKVVTAAAAVESGRYRPETIVDSPVAYDLPNSNNLVRNFGGSTCGPSRQPLAEAFRQSCNADFAKIGNDLGADALRRQAERFGFNRRFDFDLPLDASVFPDELDRPQTAISAIGQFDVRVTPLQMALVAAGVANRGRVMAPYVVSRVLDPEFEAVSTTEPKVLGGEPAMQPATAAAVAAMMQLVVERGTGTRAQIPGVAVAGKTGTAQTARGANPHAWFIGFAPADAPRVAIAVVVERGGDLGSEATGGRVAAPIARDVLSVALRGGPQ